MVKKSKYRAVKTVIDGITFDSKKEAKVYGVLKMRERAGEISHLKLQVPYRWDEICCIDINDTREPFMRFNRKYIADFVFIEKNEVKVIDVKGFRTAEYKKKKKIVEKLYNISIIEI